MKTDVYDIINERILALLDQNLNPWRKPWTAAAQKPPMNLLSRKAYRGINVLLLGMAPHESPYWVTYRQAEQAGGHVKKGEKSSIAVFWKMLDKADAKNPEKEKHIPLLRYYSIFNVEQCEGVDAPANKPLELFDHDPIAEAEKIVAAFPKPPTIEHADKSRAFYRPETDTVNMPPLDRFAKAEEYYSTLFHELTHATGHASRLNRDMKGNAQSAAYGREELIAEMGAAYLCGLAGILNQTEANTAAYLDAWRRIIKQDKRAVVLAAGAAQRAVDLITNANAAQAEEVES